MAHARRHAQCRLVQDHDGVGSGRFVKAKLEGNEFLLCHVKGFSTTYVTVNADELHQLLGLNQEECGPGGHGARNRRL